MYRLKVLSLHNAPTICDICARHDKWESAIDNGLSDEPDMVTVDPKDYGDVAWDDFVPRSLSLSSSSDSDKE